MIRQLIRPVAAGAALVGVLTLSACGGGGPTGSSSPAQASAALTTSPLDEFFTSPAANMSTEESAAQDRKVQEAVADCMAAEGFEYVPFVQTAVTSTDYGNAGTRAFAEKYGYGVSTWLAEPAPAQPTDPNQPIVDAMSDSEREAYYAALYGASSIAMESGAAAPTTVSAQPDPGDLGCFAQADPGAGGDPTSMEQFNDLFDRMSAIYDKPNQDPAVLAALDRWKTCMADAGHPGLTSTNDPVQQISDRMNKFFGNTPEGSPAPGTPGATETTVAPDTAGPDPNDPALVQLRADEIAMAVTDFDCRQSSGYQAAFDAATLAIQQQFVQDNRAELERLRDAMNGGG